MALKQVLLKGIIAKFIAFSNSFLSKVLINASFPTGVIKLPPIPCTTFAPLKNDKLGESEQSNEPKLNKINEKNKHFLVPNLSAKNHLQA